MPLSGPAADKFGNRYEGRWTVYHMLRTATGREGTSGRIPDVIGVRRDGKVDAYEVRSNTDKKSALMDRLEEGMNTLPRERRGDYDVVEP